MHACTQQPRAAGTPSCPPGPCAACRVLALGTGLRTPLRATMRGCARSGGQKGRRSTNNNCMPHRRSRHRRHNARRSWQRSSPPQLATTRMQLTAAQQQLAETRQGARELAVKAGGLAADELATQPLLFGHQPGPGPASTAFGGHPTMPLQQGSLPRPSRPPPLLATPPCHRSSSRRLRRPCSYRRSRCSQRPRQVRGGAVCVA